MQVGDLVSKFGLMLIFVALDEALFDAKCKLDQLSRKLAWSQSAILVATDEVNVSIVCSIGFSNSQFASRCSYF